MVSDRFLDNDGRTEPCRDCRGPFEFWGLAEKYRLFRCIPCQVVRFVGKDAPRAVPGEAALVWERPTPEPEKTPLRESAPLRIAS
jgi:hypothetical protein